MGSIRGQYMESSLVLISHIRGLITLLIATHEPPSSKYEIESIGPLHCYTYNIYCTTQPQYSLLRLLYYDVESEGLVFNRSKEARQVPVALKV